MDAWKVDNTGDLLDVMFLQVFYFMSTLQVGPSEVLYWNMSEEENAILAMLHELRSTCQAHTRMTFTSENGEA